MASKVVLIFIRQCRDRSL